MSSKAILPYPNQMEALELECVVPDHSKMTAPGTVDLRDVLDPLDSSISFELTVSFDSEIVGAVVPEFERSDPAWLAGVIFSSPKSRIRRLVNLKRERGGVWRGAMELDLDEMFHSAHLVPVLYRAEPSDDAIGKGFAGHPGAKLASGPSVRVLFDHFAEAGENWFLMDWKFFSKEHTLKDRSDLLFFLEIENASSMPTLLLNEDIDGLKPLLQAPEGDSHQRRLRDAVGTSIAIQVGTQLSFHLLSRIAQEVSAGGTVVELQEVKESLMDWEREVLSFWASRIFSDEDNPEMEFLERASALANFGALQAQMADEIQRISKTGKSFEGIRELEKAAEGGD